MKMRPQHITFTGADKLHQIGDMIWLSTHYPVEWGILLSESKMGQSRYPSWDFFTVVMDTNLNLSLHVCGKHARTLIETGKNPVVDQIVWGGHNHFQRVQVNASSITFEQAERIQKGIKAEVIIQVRGTFLKEVPDGVVQLLDGSGGKGIPMGNTIYPSVKTAFVGYAGGFGPNYLPHVEDQEHWIDMENNIRTDGEFDIQKCWDVCRRVYD